MNSYYFCLLLNIFFLNITHFSCDCTTKACCFREKNNKMEIIYLKVNFKSINDA